MTTTPTDRAAASVARAMETFAPPAVAVTAADLALPADLLADARRVADAMRFDQLATTDPARWARAVREELAEGRGCDAVAGYCGCPMAHPALWRLLSLVWPWLPARVRAFVRGVPCWAGRDVPEPTR